MTTPSFEGRRVLALESRRAKEIATLIRNLDGDPLVAPSLREVPLESNTEALNFAAALLRGEFDIVIFLTGVGARALVEVVGRTSPREPFIAALARVRVVARGPKPLAVLRELNVPVWAVAPEPNTWRELLSAVEARGEELPLRDARVAVQEYGVSNVELLDALRARGARVTRVPVYQWALPEDLEPLKRAVTAITQSSIDVVILTSGVQLAHLFQVAGEMGLEDEIRRGLAATVIASIGPTTSEEVERRGLHVDLAASHPKMGVLVREAAELSGDLLRTKRDKTEPER
jgi:uroporphyrinogen-III synthase